jgi:hypothetical protein
VAELDLPPVVFKTCPWQPRALVETGLRQWLRRWDLNERVGVEQPWGLDPARVAAIQAAVTRLTAGGRNSRAAPG